MMDQETKRLLATAVAAAYQAGLKILEVYDTDFAVALKDDHSPLTQADTAAHRLIRDRLADLGLPLLSEEGRDIPFAERKGWQRFWMVDPLDGTKEFVRRNGEFTVNIALIEGVRPVLGVVYVPVTETLYFAAEGVGAFKAEKVSGLMVAGRGGRVEAAVDAAARPAAEVAAEPVAEAAAEPAAEPEAEATAEATAEPEAQLDRLMSAARPLPLQDAPQRPFTVVASRSHATDDLQKYLDDLAASHPGMARVSAGSSLKFCLVAEGTADQYPRLGPTMEWDTAAGQVVVACAGGRVVHYEGGAPLAYNKENLLNPWFVVAR